MTVLRCQTVANQPTRHLANRSTDDLSVPLWPAVCAPCGWLYALLWAGGCWHTLCGRGWLAVMGAVGIASELTGVESELESNYHSSFVER